MAKKWFVQINGTEEGPITSRELAELAKSGHLRPTDLLREDSSVTWVAADRVKGLFPQPESAGSQLPAPAPPPLAAVVTSAPEPPAGLWGKLKQNVKKSIADAGRKVAGSSGGEIYTPQPDHRELSKVTSHPATKETFPWPAGAKLRLILTPDSLLFVEVPLLFGTPTVALRLPHADVLAAGTDRVAAYGLGDLMDDMRYSEKDARMLRAAEGPTTAGALVVAYRDDTKYDKVRKFVGVETFSGGMDLEEAAHHLKQLVVTREQQAQSARQTELQEQVGQLHAVAEKMQASRGRIAELQQQMVELQAAAKARREKARPKLAPTPPPEDVLAQIEKLGALRDKGLLTEDEFRAKKQELLARM